MQRDASPRGLPINDYEHCLQTATRAKRAGESEEYVVASLFHDAATKLSPANHGGIAAEALRPYVSADLAWMVAHHPVLQKQHYVHHPDWQGGLPEHVLAPLREHRAFGMTVHFCEVYDAPAFDPDYDSLPLEAFTPIVERVFSKLRDDWEV